MSIAPRTLAGLAIAGLALAATPARGQGPDEVEPESPRPGLRAEYRSRADRAAVLRRVDPRPAFAIAHSSPHPRLPAGPFEATWEGLLHVQEAGPIAFHANLGGEAEVIVDGVEVLRGRGESDVARIEPARTMEREAGLYPIRVRYRSLDGVPARLQLFWEGPGFAREPIPAWRFGHRPDAASPAARRDERAARGREIALRRGCARCHAGTYPGVDDPPPGPSLADAGRRLSRDWLLGWLEDPGRVRPGARMPALFAADRGGLVERWLVAEALIPAGEVRGPAAPATGDHRAGRRTFLGLGCAACHLVPDADRAATDDPGRSALEGLAARFGADDLAAFLRNPIGRYPDGRMPRLPLGPDSARDVAAYLFMWSKGPAARPAGPGPTAGEVADVARRLGVPPREAPAALLREKGCTACHAGLGPSMPRDVPVKAAGRGCLADRPGAAPRFGLDAAARAALAVDLAIAPGEVHPSPAASRRRRLAWVGCVRCHQRDTDRPPPIEAVAAGLGGAFLQTLPYQRTPRLSDPLQKYTRRHLVAAVREGVAGLRPADYTYRMPAYGAEAETLVQALAEADGELPAGPEPAAPPDPDPTLGPLYGPALVGSRGYGCIGCHVWAGKQLSRPDPGAVGPDLTRVVGRIRRDWFDRFLEDPARSHPNTPMPAIFPRGRPATLGSVLGSDPARQKEALWGYLAAGASAPAPEPPRPVPVAAPDVGDPPRVAQIPIRMPGGEVVEALCVLDGHQDLFIYDLARGAPRGLLVGAEILRDVEGRLRRFLAAGTPVGGDLAGEPAWQLVEGGRAGAVGVPDLHGYDLRDDGARLRWRARFGAVSVEVEETLGLDRKEAGRLVRRLRLSGVPEGAAVAVRSRAEGPGEMGVRAEAGSAAERWEGGILTATLSPDRDGTVVATLQRALPPARRAPKWEGGPPPDPGRIVGPRERPGYRAIAFPRPKTIAGEDRVMPAAIAVHPRDGRVFVASLKTGELFVVRDPGGDGRRARFEDYARGLFQDALSLRAEDDALYVLHRRNLTRVTDSDGDGRADRFDRVAALPHGVAETYDYGYGLVRDRTGAFLVSYAPYANTHLAGSGGVVRLVPGRPPRELAFGFRNPLGWCEGPGGEVFFTDNQGEWVAANKLCHLEEGRYYGFPNPAQRRHADRPPGRAAVWVPYGWARSINGVAYEHTGKFGPFSGQFFLAELMFGGAIVRADVERVNGRYQGACFPFWGQGLLGPVALAFGPEGGLYVGGITEPGWMAQPDRGALFRIDFTGETPFEIRTIRARPRGFRLVFTRPVERTSAADPASYRIEHYRYELTGSYGSPELDRTSEAVGRVAVSADGRDVEVELPRLVAGRVYRVAAPGVRSASGERLVHDTGAYTLNEIPREE